eukprot:scaffold234951_cov14-Tisochrysis_lutea.AAC.1
MRVKFEFGKVRNSSHGTTLLLTTVPVHCFALHAQIEVKSCYGLPNCNVGQCHMQVVFPPIVENKEDVWQMRNKDVRAASRMATMSRSQTRMRVTGEGWRYGAPGWQETQPFKVGLM